MIFGRRFLVSHILIWLGGKVTDARCYGALGGRIQGKGRVVNDTDQNEEDEMLKRDTNAYDLK